MLRERLGLPGQQGRLRAGRVRVVLGAGRRRAGVLAAWCWRRGRRAARSPPSRASPRRARSPTSSRPFVDAGAVQCGFCTPGPGHGRRTTCSSAAPSPTELEVREALSGNLCRCTGYGRIIEAVQRVAVDPWRGSWRRSRRDASTIRLAPAHDAADHGSARSTSAPRPDGVPKVQGSFHFSGDLSADGMLWGATLRSPHPYARIRSIDMSARWRIAGVEAVITADDVPGEPTYGLDHAGPAGLRRRGGALRRRARGRGGGRPPRDAPAGRLAAIVVEYEVLDPLTDPEGRSTAPRAIHPDGNVFRHRGSSAATRRRGRGDRRGHLRDRHAGPGLPRPRGRPGGARPGDGGVELLRLHPVAPRRPRPDRRLPRVCPEDGAAHARRGGRRVRRPEDVSLQVHTCLLALRTGRPVKIVVQPRGVASSATSTATRRASGCATTPPRRAHRQRIEARIVLDGGAYASTSSAVIANASPHTPGPYRCDQRHRRRLGGAHQQPAVRGDARLRRRAGVLRPRGPDGPARRGAAGIDPVELRLAQRDAHRRPADHRPGDRRTSRRWPRCIRETAALPLPDDRSAAHDGDPMRLPGGAGRTADASHVRRGIGFAVAIKNLMYSEGFDDYSTARCRLADGVATVKFATAEVGPGLRHARRSRSPATVLGVDDVVLEPIDTTIGSAGSTSASRQTWMSGGAVDGACRRCASGCSTHVGAAGTASTRCASPIDGARRGRHRWATCACRSPSATAGLELERDRRAPPPPHRGPRRGRPGRLPHRVRLRRPPGRRRRRPRARPGARWSQIATAQDVGRALNPLQRARPDRGRASPRAWAWR